MSPASAARSVVLGLGWGGFAYLFGQRMIGPPIWGGVLAAPVIGLLVGRLTLGPFQVGSGRRRAVISLGGLVAAAILFGLAVGIADLLLSPQQRIVETMFEGVAGVLWGLTMTGSFLFLWPLAYGCCWLLAWLD